MIGVVQQQNPPQGEKCFQMNLLRLAGRTDIVTTENMFEVIVYASQNGISEVLFVEENYLGCYFTNDEFMAKIGLHNCSLPDLIRRYEEAKSKNEADMLSAFRAVHRQARLFLQDEEIKINLKQLCAFRSSVNQYQAFINMIQVMLNYTREYFTHAPVINLIQGIFPSLAQNVPRLENNNEGGAVVPKKDNNSGKI